MSAPIGSSSTSAPVYRVPREVLLMIFGYVHDHSFSWHNFSSTTTPYRDLVACSKTCKEWAALVPRILYRNIRLPAHQQCLEGVERPGTRARQLFSSVRRNTRPGTSVARIGIGSFVSSVSLDVQSYGSERDFRMPQCVQLLLLCPRLRSVAIRIRGTDATEHFQGPELETTLNWSLRQLSGVTDLALSSHGAMDMERILYDFLSVWPNLRRLDISSARFQLEQRPVLGGGRSWSLIRNLKLQHIRASHRRDDLWLVKILTEACVDRSSQVSSLQSAFLRFEAHETLLAHTSFAQMTTIRLIASEKDALRVFLSLSQIKTLHTYIIAASCSDDTVLLTIPDHVVRLGIEFMAGFCASAEGIAEAVSTRLPQIRYLDVYVSCDPKSVTDWSAQFVYCQRLENACTRRSVVFSVLPKNSLDFLNN